MAQVTGNTEHVVSNQVHKASHNGCGAAVTEVRSQWMQFGEVPSRIVSILDPEKSCTSMETSQLRPNNRQHI
ncbi:unnamed protein product [Haemonchus placei]|uniref:Uncharacterized protein n=1 Tax=Haemonchus placei TaxID=6290 RepID=A0A0N4WQ50_HAEPC|nr:unnamed protein product [Haemonchus placei]